MKLDFDKMSRPRKMILTALGLLYALSMLGNAFYKDTHMIVGATLCFVTLTMVLFLWIK